MNLSCVKKYIFSVALSFSLACTAVAEVIFDEQEISAIALQGPWPVSTPQDPGNEFSGLLWAERLGSTLFDDTQLSHNMSVACSTCHQADKGFADGRSLSKGEAIGIRNTIGLFNSGLQRWFGWDGGTDSLWAASIRPLFTAHEMASSVDEVTKALRANHMFVSAIEEQAASVENLADLDNEAVIVLAGKVIAAYVRTLRSGRTAFDDYRDALISGDIIAQEQYPKDAKRGLKIFIGEANCRVCHFGSNFSNSEFHDIGRPFFIGVGQVDSGRYSGIQRIQKDPYSLNGHYGIKVPKPQQLKTANVKLSQSNWGQWRTPSLRNLSFTAPYMHDGSLETLRDVVDWYADIDPTRLHSQGEAILKPLNLNERQREDLVAFLRTLSVK